MKKYYSMFFVVCIINFSCGGGEVKTDGHADSVYEEDLFEETTDIQKDLIDVQEDLTEEATDIESEVPITCGNGIVDDGEECDDEKNGNPDDGCTDECRYSCHVDSDCSDGEICNGEEICNLEYHVCSEGTPHEDGFVCLSEPRSICLNGECRESICGDGFIDSGAGEFCEPPGNNGCKEDCTFECNNDFECYNDEVCDGEEFCDLTTHTCAHRNVPPEGAECGTDPRKICLGGRCQVSVCGDTFVDTGSFEECDDGNAIEGDGCDNDCTFSCHSNSECDDGHICTDNICTSSHTCDYPFLGSETVCRVSAGACDIEERCDGANPDCPVNSFRPSGYECRASMGICDVVEYCTGFSPLCPADGFLSSDTVCRPSAGPCDVTEHCSGTSAECPVDSFLSSDTICRPSAGDCDIAEYCTGTSAACPRDAFLPSTTVCRPSTGPCDAEEYCTGSSATCPPDAPPPVETCNGLDDDCDDVCDDGFECCRGITESCTTTCGTTGTKICSNWCTWGSCVPPTETCNGIDDDCDGTVDEGTICPPGQSCIMARCVSTPSGCRVSHYLAHTYALCGENSCLSWSDARNRCISIGGYLATATSSGEDTFLLNWASSMGWDVWFGLYRDSLCVWRWVTAEPVSYTNWAPGQPDGSCPDQECGQYWSEGSYRWDNNWCDRCRGYFCEWDG